MPSEPKRASWVVPVSRRRASRGIRTHKPSLPIYLASHPHSCRFHPCACVISVVATPRVWVVALTRAGAARKSSYRKFTRLVIRKLFLFPSVKHAHYVNRSVMFLCFYRVREEYSGRCCWISGMEKTEISRRPSTRRLWKLHRWAFRESPLEFSTIFWRTNLDSSCLYWYFSLITKSIVTILNLYHDFKSTWWRKKEKIIFELSYVVL